MITNEQGLVGTLAALITRAGAEWVLWLLLALSVLSVAVMLERWLYYLRRRLDVDALASSLSEKLATGDLVAARALVEGGRALEARVAADGIEALSRGQGPRVVEETVGRAVARERRGYERALWFLGTLGNNAPFIGLFGTVLGIIKAFSDLSGDMRGGAGVVMGGVSEALVATAVGLMVALPAVVAYNICRKSISRTITGSELLTRTLQLYAHEQVSR